jgi:acetyl esterase/lipase
LIKEFKKMFKKYILLLACAVVLGAAGNLTSYTYKTVGDLQIKLDVYTPPVHAPEGGYPLFFAMHGGAYICGSKKSVFANQELPEVMKRGWVAVSIDYRLLPGAVLQEVLEDVQDAYKWVRTELVKKTPLNLDLVTVFGRSAGGGLAVLSGYKLSPRPQVVIGFYSGLSNWTDPLLFNPSTPVNPALVAAANKLSVPVITEYAPLKTGDPRKTLLMSAVAEEKAGWLAVTHDPSFPDDKVKEILRDFSATENVDKNYPPTYLAHGTSDITVPYIQSVQLANRLKAENIPYVLDLIPGAGHDFDLNPDTWEQHVLPAFEFAQKYMQTSTKKGEMKFLEI